MFVYTTSIYALNLHDYLTTKRRDHRSLYALYIMWSPGNIQVDRKEGKGKKEILNVMEVSDAGSEIFVVAQDF